MHMSYVPATPASIPKTIHYCWFGGAKLSPLVEQCIASWKLFLPDYEIKLWNEETFDISRNRFSREAYAAKRWAFVSDFVRASVLYEHGGIYMDTDVEVLKSLDRFLQHPVFLGFENNGLISTGIIGARKQHWLIGELLHHYENLSFYRDNGRENIKPNTFFLTALAKNHGFTTGNYYQILCNEVHVYPSDYFCPKNSRSNQIELTENSYTIHHFEGSWLPVNRRFKKNLRLFWMALFGQERYDRFSNFLKRLGRKNFSST
ncbi:MAG: glycosyltransferase family 32 protein [Sporomusa sp.]